MKLASVVGFMMISMVGSWVGPIPATQGPEMAGFIPAGQLPQTSAPTPDDEGCL